MRVYIVSESVEDDTHIVGVYQNLEDAQDHAADLAEYAGLDKDGDYRWSFNGNRPMVTIDWYQVL